MKSLLTLVCMVAACSLGDTQDIRSMVKGKDDVSMPSHTIDPDGHIFGIAFGTHEDEVIKAFGKPDGYLRLAGTESCMIYGKATAFLFEDGKLHGVRISYSVLDWRLSQHMTGNALFDHLPWKLNNGINYEMPLTEVKKILGDKLSEDRFDRFYRTAEAVVRLDFSHYTNEGDSDSAYRICGITVEKK